STATTVSVPLRKALHSASACWSARVLASLPSTGTRIFIGLHPPREHGFYAGASPAGVARRAPGACTDPGEARRRRGGSLLDEGALEHVIARGADARRGGEPAPVQERAEVGQHLWAAADHGAVPGRVERLKAEVGGHAPAVEQVGQAAALAAALPLERLAAYRRVVQQLARDLLAEELVPRQFVEDVVAIGQVGRATHAVGHDHALEALVGVRV